MKERTFSSGEKLELVKTSALNLGNGQNFAYNVYYTDGLGNKNCVARVRDVSKANEIFDQYSQELES